MIANTQKINPMPVITGAAKYPEGIMETLDAKVDLCALDALALAKEAGNVKAVNVVLMGVMAKSTNIPYETWVTAVRECVPAKFLDANLRAFDAGYHYVKE
jgi:indolepyruvate ferredoxin oxidoreductase beta subunit